MVHRVVARVVALDGDVALPFVRVDRLGLVVDIPVDEQVERLPGHAGDAFEANPLAALECARHSRMRINRRQNPTDSLTGSC